ncbi:MAG: glycoside hydrolase family 44, partial [Draconibacterium sp.]|nr:glycoside hydrolase family 44 [Draconibacterium sp.]
ANEWQWYRYGNDGISWNGKKYCWLEYFILRIAEEEKATGLKLLDVLDIHYYPGSSDATKLVQFYRVFFDRNYIYPEANGVKTVTGGWDNNQNKEYILGRCSDWLVKYKGAEHGVKFGVTETGLNTNDANVQASWYASTMGVFMKNGVEIFTPWSWSPGMWETVHLFSRFSQSILLTQHQAMKIMFLHTLP